MLSGSLEQYKEAYRDGKPFPHIVIDDAFSYPDLVMIAGTFPEPSPEWWVYNNALEKKLAYNDLKKLPQNIVQFINYLNSNPFISEIEKLTGIEGLIADHTLNGAGLHQIVAGGKLDVHADYNYHPITRLDRRVNVLIYLNYEWSSLWSGNLELWDENMTECQKSIQPIFNRMVVFSTSDKALHGHPDPLKCPEGYSRKSIAMYYYTNGRPKEETTAPHSTLFKRRPCDPLIEEIEELRQKRSVRRV